ncbi:ArsR/SmtB family transcription factor [Saccharothrix deserti]|uniref:ArsR/SmtB family transcription factor n=1 Tax=Saccharothrix deserti TaxID=2593674 RepID=UPI00131AE5F1|nr:helix-turn-helix domain-containing protein [Saccharothrix deserti]
MDVADEVVFAVATAVRGNEELSGTAASCLKVFAALGHPTRLAVVIHLLQVGPRSAVHLQQAAGLTSPGRLYHHLNVLLDSGLVERGLRSRYRLRPEPAAIRALIAAAADVDR